ncbi:MAG: acetyl-CoA carboxylase biotin carboxyl carrier protein [Aestuariivita sp.]|nr:acetyl-CoA carboxylase biotin carboxyl carrier protein [Aestuariivita sp.]
MVKKSKDIDVELIKELTELLHNSNLAELHIERQFGDNNSLSVRMSANHMRAESISAANYNFYKKNTENKDIAVTPAHPPDDLSHHPGVVISPMVGTVYMQLEPGAAAFITVGADVNEGDTLLIVEAMKTMNHIPAHCAGKIKRILVEDGTAVEYGTPLVIIE